MANEMYGSSWWGEGVITNTINWGEVYYPYALISELHRRAPYYENFEGTDKILTDLENCL
jgi:hypothetical protein|tara:strand:+ start:494 stop:673 length:180 start_codon:yes stop_codon:yes gene_type:complete